MFLITKNTIYNINLILKHRNLLLFYRQISTEKNIRFILNAVCAILLQSVFSYGSILIGQMNFIGMLWTVKSGNIVGGAFQTVCKMDYAPALRAIELPEMIFCIGVMV